jgi:DNA repair protein RadC
MYSKLERGDNLFDHELLEILLYNAYPRMDTNPIAHNLLERFPSLYEVLTAGIDELTAVEGVGENVAVYLKCVGECSARACLMPGLCELKNYGDIKRFCSMRMSAKREEALELYALDKNGLVKRIFTHTSNDKHGVRVNMTDIISFLASAKPYGLVITHNHPTAPCTPTVEDDVFTNQIALACTMNNIIFYDHCIQSEVDGVFSYHDSGRIDNILKNNTLSNIMEKWTTITE